jgi:uncharacterized protein involved in exopolysaccharide biosynthesis/Mrp family chromosome partitioning ATPase
MNQPADTPSTVTPLLPDLTNAISFFKRHLALIILGMLVGIVLGAIISALSPKVYRVSGKFLVNELPYAVGATFTDAESSRQIIQTFILSIPSEDMLNEVAKNLGISTQQISFADRNLPLSLRAATPQANIRLAVARNSRIGQIEVESQDPEFALAVTDALLREIESLNLVAGQIARIDLNLTFLGERAQGLVAEKLVSEAERLKSENQIRELNSHRELGLPLEDFPAFSEDKTLNNLKTQLILVQSEYDAVARQATRGPRLEGKRSELLGLRSQVKNYAEALRKALVSQMEIYKKRDSDLEIALKETEQKIGELKSQKAEVFKGYRDASIRARLSEEAPGNIGSTSIAIVDRGFIPSRTVKPRWALNLFLGFVFGTGLGLAAAFGRSLVDDRVRTPVQQEARTGLACLAVVHAKKTAESLRRNIPLNSNTSRGVSYLADQLIRQRLSGDFSNILGFTSASDENCSDLVADLAVALAQAEKRTLVVDLHFDAPVVAQRLGIESGKGLIDWMMDEAPISSFVRYSAIRELAVLDTGKPVSESSELLSRNPFAPELLAMAKDWDFILVDAPPILSQWHLLLALPPGQNLILATHYQDTKIQDIQIIQQRCLEAKIRILGTVLVGFPEEPRRSGVREEDLGYHRYVWDEELRRA